MLVLETLNAEEAVPHEDGWMLHTPGGGPLEDRCPCLTPKLCPRIFGQSPLDSQQFGHIPICRDPSMVRCCGVTITNKTGYKNPNYARNSETAEMQTKDETNMQFIKTRMAQIMENTHNSVMNIDTEKDYEDTNDEDNINKTSEGNTNLTQSVVFVYPSTVPPKKCIPFYENESGVYIILPTKHINNSESVLIDQDNTQNKINMRHETKAESSITSRYSQKSSKTSILNEKMNFNNNTEISGHIQKKNIHLHNTVFKTNHIMLNKHSKEASHGLSSSNKRRSLLSPQNRTVFFLNEYLKQRSQPFYIKNKNYSVNSISEGTNISVSSDADNVFADSSESVKIHLEELTKNPVMSIDTNKPNSKQMSGASKLTYLRGLKSTGQTKNKIHDGILQFHLQQKINELLRKNHEPLIHKSQKLILEREISQTSNPIHSDTPNKETIVRYFTNGLEKYKTIGNIEQMLISNLLEDHKQLQKEMITKKSSEMEKMFNQNNDLNCNMIETLQLKNLCRALKTSVFTNRNHINKCVEKFDKIKSKNDNKTGRECVRAQQQNINELIRENNMITADLESSDTAQHTVRIPIKSNFNPPSKTEGGFIPIERPVLSIVGPIPKGFRDQKQQNENNFETTVDGILMSQLLVPYASVSNFRNSIQHNRFLSQSSAGNNFQNGNN